MYRVVLVDDEQIILQGLQKVIPWEKYGCQVVGTAPDGVQGARVIEEKQPHILFTDIRMPNRDGLTMVAALKSQYPHMQVSVLTAFRDFDYAQQAIRLGVCRYLLKPSKLDEIQEALSAMIAILEQEGGAPPQAEPEAEAQGPAGSFIVKQALQYIDGHYMQRITLTEVADSVFVSQWHLSKLLNRHTGKSFFDLLGQVRIEKAQALLADPSLKVGEIAEMVGFLDVAHFSKTFKKIVGKSPVKYRAEL